jgi:hypothetical protein
LSDRRRPTLVPTAPVAAGSLIAGYAVAVESGSRPLGGVVLLLGGLWCLRQWRRRAGSRIAARLTAVGLALFVASHLLALAIGAWPAVLSVAAAMAASVWLGADVRVRGVTDHHDGTLGGVQDPGGSAPEELRLQAP